MDQVRGLSSTVLRLRSESRWLIQGGDMSEANLIRTSVDNERRRFMRHSIAGALGTAVAFNHPVYAIQATGSDCGSPSQADWMVTASFLVTPVATEAYNRIADEAQTQLTTYKSAFDDLYCLLNSLASEINKSTASSPEVKQLQTLTEVARVNGSFVKTALVNGEDAKGLFLTLSLVSQQICDQAQNLRPADAELTLSKTATAILRKIVELVRSEKFVELHNGVARTETTSSRQRDEVNRLISELQLGIRDARDAILLAENPTPRNSNGEPITVNVDEQWKLADRRMAETLRALKSLIAQNLVKSFLANDFVQRLPDVILSKPDVTQALETISSNHPQDNLPVSDSLVLGLGNCRTQLGSWRNNTASIHGEFRIVNTNYTATLAVDRNAMATLLWNCCPPGSRDQIDRVDTIVAFVGGWNSWIPRALREQIIASTLFWAVQVNGFKCSGNHDLKALAKGLAALV
ncbi:MAG: hypothetical protein C5B55_01215 [Blastocatellia bacterium]|nr:MAG: hypothetical protein C5B55_01215 [Blastocatellia bacterium]